MKKRRILISFATFLLLSNVACNNTNISSTELSETLSESSNYDRDVDYSTNVPILDEDSIQIHYKRNDNRYNDWTLWLWAPNKDGQMYDFNYQDEFGVIASYPLSLFDIDPQIDNLGLIVRNKDNTWTKDAGSSDDRFVDFSALEKDTNGVYHIYLISGEEDVYTSMNKDVADIISYVRFETTNKISCTVNKPLSKFDVYEDGLLVGSANVAKEGVFYVVTLPENKEIDIKKTYTADIKFKGTNNEYKVPISIRKIYKTDKFNEDYYFDGELGAIYDKNYTTFRVWSPISTKIVLRIYENGTPSFINNDIGSDSILNEIEMTSIEKGVFETNVNGDLEGKYYTYVVYNSTYPKGKEIVDPYAKSTGVNGLRGMIVDFSKTNPEGWENISPIAYDRKELTVYETHVADVTSSSTWNGTETNRKKFLGLIEEGTTYTEEGITVKTGFDHIKELGVNAVQLIPVFDQANDEVNVEFNWGYNPLNYNVIEGCYSSNPYDGYARIKEFKQVIQKYNEAGINIIMDVVYNHTNGLAGSNFDVLMPGYYFRYTDFEKASNGSGCGNETASDNKMFRKFMIDSTSFLANEYKLGGFRFDLMALHDLDTMNELVEELENINPNICVYGEPWNGGNSALDSTKQCSQVNANKYQGYGQFNDQARDALIKGGMKGVDELGWISGTNKNVEIEVNQIIAGIKGITKTILSEIKDPNKTVNYVTCHDNYTLYDRFKAAGIDNEEVVKKMAMLANSVVFTSQATTFMLAGEEFLRTKDGDHNSYMSSYEVNELDYSLKIKHMDMFENYKKLINFKQDVDGMHLDVGQNTLLDVETYDDLSLFKYTILDSINNVEYVVIHSNGVNAETKSLIDLSGYKVYLDTLNKYEENTSLSNVTPKAYQTIICYK